MRPKVITWFNVYVIVLCLLYVFVSVVGLFFLLVPHEKLEKSLFEALFTGSVCFGLGILLLASCIVPFIFRPRPWLWVYNLVLICIGMTSTCFLPASIVLLIFWLKPEVKRYYNRIDQTVNNKEHQS
jgi:hypothetical protein